MGGGGSGQGQGAEAGRGRGWALLTYIRGGRRTPAEGRDPPEPAPCAALGPPKLGGPRSAAHSPLPLRRGAFGLPHPWTPLGLARPGLRHPRAHRGPSRKLASADPAIHPQAPKFPRNTFESGWRRPSWLHTNQEQRPRGPLHPARAGRARSQRAGQPSPPPRPRALAALWGCPRKGSPEPPSLQWDQSGKRDLPGEKARRAESQSSPLES